MRAFVRKRAVSGDRPCKNRKLTLGILAAVSGGLGGCGGKDDSGGTATSGTTAMSSTGAGPTSTTGAPAGCLSATAEDGSLSLLIDPANNYAFDSTVTFNVQSVAPNTPLNFDWSALSIDLMKQPIDPAGGDVAAVLVSLMGLTVQQFQDKLNANQALNNDSKGALAFYPTTETRANIYEFSSPGDFAPRSPEEIDPYLDPGPFPPEENTFAVLIQDDREPARGVRMVQAFKLDPNSLNTDVILSNTSSDLVYQTDLARVVPLQVPVGTANITADWRGMNDVASNALGDPWLKGVIEEVMIGRYDLTPAQLTEQFLGLENIAAEMYRGPVPEGSRIHLSTLVEETSGAPFAGISGTGTWILALNCLKCTNPAPWFLTILQPCP